MKRFVQVAIIVGLSIVVVFFVGGTLLSPACMKLATAPYVAPSNAANPIVIAACQKEHDRYWQK